MSKKSEINTASTVVTAEGRVLTPAELKKQAVEEHKRYCNINDFDLYAFEKEVKYIDRDTACAFIPLAAKRVAFRLRFPQGYIDVSDPVLKDGYSSICATVYIPKNKREDEVEYTPIATGRGFFLEPGYDCQNVYKAQDRALRAALNNAGFQGVNEGSDTTGDGMSNIDPFYGTEDDPFLPTAAASAPEVVQTITNDAPKGRKKGTKEKAATETASETATKDAPNVPVTRAYALDAYTSELLETKIFYQGISGTLAVLIRTKIRFVEHLASQYQNNIKNLDENEIKQCRVCYDIVKKMSEDAELRKYLTE